MAWKGKFLGALVGLLLTRSLWGALIGAFIGELFDRDAGVRPGAPTTPPVAALFFRTTFEMMGHVAKADGRVSEAEIDAARRLMRELALGPEEVAAAIDHFRAGKARQYDAEAAALRLYEACAPRHDLLTTFVELQLRAALDGNDLSPPARAILTRVADRLGIGGLEFVRIEAALRAARARARTTPGGRSAEPLAHCYAELEVDPGSSDREVTKAYRRQMSRHHPDKLFAQGLPESMMRMAKEKTQRIQEAYEQIRAARGMR
ncbi:MAG: co-chaperone DjlA [Gammaproteobacteria bacterium]|nr:co-chaperone DjlA [Gammaproteobacteria bacterium]